MIKLLNSNFSKKNLPSRGFTLIEVMTSLTIFAVIMTISMGSILGVFDANRKSESFKSVLDNMNFAVETMTREMRFGINYHCGSTGDMSLPQDCSGVGGSPAGGNVLAFKASDGRQITYLLNQTKIQKSIDAINYIDITAPEVTITGLTFYVVGSSPGDSHQPRILFRVSGYAGSKPGLKTSFTLQSMITQRLRDN